LEQTLELASILKKSGVDLIDCSSGGNIIDQNILLGPGYQVQFSEAIRMTGVLTSAVGMITSVDQINSILVEEKADLILLGRELLRNPYLTLQIDTDISGPIQYLRAKNK
jgi:2,4-dienoyl-CoA reductase-like NADH-dependent reductase (Old Yellow Enzyme family)